MERILKKPAIKQLKQDNLKGDQMDSSLESNPKIKVNNTGLGTSLKVENTKKFVPKGSENLEKFLHCSEVTLLKQLPKAQQPTPSQKSQDHRELLKD
eukprot:11759750-Ditylum_brightwellii.AAC.1